MDNQNTESTVCENEILENETLDNAENIEKCESKENNELLELKKQSADYLDKLQRLGAEFDNFRKRTIKEKASMYDDGVRDAIEKLLPVIDNFERAISLINDKEEPFAKGVLMIFKMFSEYLETMGVKEIAAHMEKFNPEFHFAVAHSEDESAEANTVVEVMQKGYIYKDKVIRHSVVKVAN